MSYRVIELILCMLFFLAKHTTKTWKEKGIIGPCVYTLIPDRVNHMVIPSKIGCIPPKYVLDLLPSLPMNGSIGFWFLLLCTLWAYTWKRCWGKFILGCRLLCLPVITKSQINEVVVILADFCCTYEALYGKQSCTPNIHMSLHLKQCMLDFGPLSAFWCFPFERYNGTLERFKKSWSSWQYTTDDLKHSLHIWDNSATQPLFISTICNVREPPTTVGGLLIHEGNKIDNHCTPEHGTSDPSQLPVTQR